MAAIAEEEAKYSAENGGLDLPAETPTMGEAAERIAMAPQWQLMWWKFRRHRLALISLVVIIILYIVALFAGFFAPKSADPANLQTPSDRGKQVFAVRLRLKRPDARVKAGMYTTVKQIGKWRP